MLISYYHKIVLGSGEFEHVIISRLNRGRYQHGDIVYVGEGKGIRSHEIVKMCITHSSRKD